MTNDLPMNLVKADWERHWHETHLTFEGWMHRWIVKHSTPNQHEMRILDVGAGLGEHLKHNHNLVQSNYYALDLEQSHLDVIKRRFPMVNAIHADVQAKLGFADGFFDKVVAINVLEHLPRLNEALGEIFRVLKHGGEFCVVIPCEGGRAYNVARYLTAKRVFESRYGIPYGSYIHGLGGHCHTAQDLMKTLECSPFALKRLIYFPLLLNSININLVIGLIMRKE